MSLKPHPPRPLPDDLPQSGAQPAPFGFTGELHHGSLQYLRARWYDPGEGVLLGRDPFVGWSERPDSLHPYIYAGNDPVLYTDPSGETWYLDENNASELARQLGWVINDVVLAIAGLGAGGSAGISPAANLPYIHITDPGMSAIRSASFVSAVGITGGCIAGAVALSGQARDLYRFKDLIEANTGTKGIAIGTDNTNGVRFLNRDQSLDQQGRATIQYWRPSLLGQLVIIAHLPSSMQIGHNPPVNIGNIRWWEGLHFPSDSQHFAPS